MCSANPPASANLFVFGVETFLGLNYFALFLPGLFGLFGLVGDFGVKLRDTSLSFPLF